MKQQTDPRMDAVNYSTSELRERVTRHESVTELLHAAQRKANLEIERVQKSLREPVVG